MLHGRFGDTSGRPYLEGLLILTRLNIRSEISFLVDTGSDVTLLNPLDGFRMGVDYSRLTGHADTGGIGGGMKCFLEPALVVFREADRLVTYNIDYFHISHPEDVDDTLNSILGRDVLDRLRMVYNPSADQLTFTVKSADHFSPL